MNLKIQLSAIQLRADNARVVDFLCSCAAAFNRFSLSTDSESLRLALHSIQSDEVDRGQPIFQTITENKVDFIFVLSSRYGNARLGSNLLRFTLCPIIGRLAGALVSWGMDLVPLAKRSFNRRFMIFENDHCERQTLYSGVLLELSEKINHASQKLLIIEQNLREYFPHAMASNSEKDYELDLELANLLGFKGLCWSKFPALSDRILLSQAAETVNEILLCVEEIYRHIQHQPTDCELGIQLICRKIRQEIGYCKTAQGHESSLAAIDFERLQIIESFEKTVTLVDLLHQNFAACIKSHQMDSNVSTFEKTASKDVERRVITSLLSEGHPVKQACLATRDLVTYLDRNNVKAKHIISSELAKINQNLNQTSLDHLQDFCTSNENYLTTESEKKKLLEKTTSLTKEFDKKLSSLVKLGVKILLLVFVSGCGLKTDPKNSQLDFRPPIPEKGAFTSKVQAAPARIN